MRMTGSAMFSFKLQDRNLSTIDMENICLIPSFGFGVPAHLHLTLRISAALILKPLQELSLYLYLVSTEFNVNVIFDGKGLLI